MKKIIAFLCCLIFTTAFADITVPMYLVSKTGAGKTIGSVTIQKTHYGILFIPHLTDLTAGVHGFHIHEKPSCADEGMAAGGHWDPKKTGKHLGPYNDHGHLGDLPALTANADGTAVLPVLAPRLTSLSELKGHALMIHAGGDNYSDEPPMGGGGARFACGVIK